MNKIYKVVWSKVKNCYVVVSELAKNVLTGGVKSAKVGCVPAIKGMALGALMAFVITGNAWAENYKYADYKNETVTSTGSLSSEGTGEHAYGIYAKNSTVTLGSNGAVIKFDLTATANDGEAVAILGDSDSNIDIVADKFEIKTSGSETGSLQANGGTKITVTANEADVSGVIWSGGEGSKVDLTQVKDFIVSDSNGYPVVQVADKGTVLIGSYGNKTTVTGDVYANNGGGVRVVLGTEDSTFTGSTKVDNNDGAIVFRLYDGATWNVTESSNISKLSGNNLNVVAAQGAENVKVTIDGDNHNNEDIYEDVYDKTGLPEYDSSILNFTNVDLAIVDTEGGGLEACGQGAETVINSNSNVEGVFGEVGIEVEGAGVVSITGKNITFNTGEDTVLVNDDTTINVDGIVSNKGMVIINATGDVSLSSTTGNALNNNSTQGSEIKVTGANVNLVSNSGAAIAVGHIQSETNYNGIVTVGDENTKVVTITGATGDLREVKDEQGNLINYNEDNRAIIYSKGTVNITATDKLEINDTTVNKKAIAACGGANVIVDGGKQTIINGEINADGHGYGVQSNGSIEHQDNNIPDDINIHIKGVEIIINADVEASECVFARGDSSGIDNAVITVGDENTEKVTIGYADSGLVASNGGSKVVVNSDTLIINADGSFDDSAIGISVYNDSSVSNKQAIVDVNADRTEITAEDEQLAYGIGASGESIVNITGDLMVTTTGCSAYGAAAVDGGTVNVNGNVDITAAGYSAYGIEALNGSTVQLGSAGKTVSITTTGIGESGESIAVYADNSMVDISAGSLTIGATSANQKQPGSSLQAKNGGMVNVNASNADITGLIYADGEDSIVNVTVNENADIVGDLVASNDGSISMTLKTEGSSFTGATKTNGIRKGVGLNLVQGATWYVTDDSTVSSVVGDVFNIVSADKEKEVAVTIDGSTPDGMDTDYESTKVNIGGVDLVIRENDDNALGGKVTIDSDSDVTVEAGKDGINVGNGHNVNIIAENITFKTGTDYINEEKGGAVHVYGNGENTGEVHIQASENVELTSNKRYAVNNRSKNGGLVEIAGKNVTLVSNNRTAVKAGGNVGDQGCNGVVNIGDEKTETIDVKGYAQKASTGNEQKASAVFAQGDGNIKLSASNTITITDTRKNGGNAIGTYEGGTVNVEDAKSVVVNGKVYATGRGSTVNITNAGNIELTSTNGSAINNASNDAVVNIGDEQTKTVTITGATQGSREVYDDQNNFVNYNEDNRAVIYSKGIVNITATEKVVINDTGEKTLAVAAYGGANVTIDGGKETIINGEVCADGYGSVMQSDGNVEHQDNGIADNINVLIKGAEIIVDASLDAEEGIFARGDSTGIDNAVITVGDVNTNKVTIKDVDTGLFAWNGGSKVEVNSDTLVISANADFADSSLGIAAINNSNSDNKRAVVSVNANKTKITSKDGDFAYGIYANGQSDVNVSGDMEVIANGTSAFGVETKDNAYVELGDADSNIIFNVSADEMDYSGESRAEAIHAHYDSIVKVGGNMNATVAGRDWVSGVESTRGSTVELGTVTLNVSANGNDFSEASGINVARKGTVNVSGNLEANVTGGEWATGVEAYNGSLIEVGTANSGSSVNINVTAYSQNYGDFDYVTGAYGVFAYGQTIPTDDEEAYGGSNINIDADQLTISTTYANGMAYGILAGDNSTVNANGDVDITATGYSAHGLEVMEESTVQLGAVGKNVSITAISTGESGESIAVWAGDNSKVDIIADTLNVDIKNIYDGGSLQAKRGSTISVNANNAAIHGIVHASGEGSIVNLSQAKNIKLTSDEFEEYGISPAVQAKKGGKVLIGNEAGKTEVLGDVFAHDDGQVDLILATADSVLAGTTNTKLPEGIHDNDYPNEDGIVNLTLSNGATWNVTDDSKVTTLAGTSGIIEKDSNTTDTVTVTIHNNNDNDDIGGEGNYSGAALTNNNLTIGEGVDLVVDTWETSIYNQNIKIDSDSNVTIKSAHDDAICVYGDVVIGAQNVTIEAYDNGIKSGVEYDTEDANNNGEAHIPVGKVTIVADEDVTIKSIETGEGYAITNVSTEGGKIDVEAGGNVELISYDRPAVRVGYKDDGEFAGVTFNGTVSVAAENIIIEGKAREHEDGEFRPSVIYAQGEGTLNLSATDTIIITNTYQSGNLVGAYDGGTVNIEDTTNLELDGRVYATGEGSNINITSAGDVVYNAKTQFATENNGVINIAGGNVTGELNVIGGNVNLIAGNVTSVLNVAKDSTVTLSGATYTTANLNSSITGEGKLVIDGSGVLKTTANQVFTVGGKDTITTDADVLAENAVNNNAKEKVTFKSGILSLNDDYSIEYLDSITGVMKDVNANATKIVMTGDLIKSDDSVEEPENNKVNIDDLVNNEIYDGVELDKVTVEADKNLIIGVKDNESTDVKVSAGKDENGNDIHIEVEDSVEKGFSANQLDLGAGSTGAVITGGQEIVLGGSQNDTSGTAHEVITVKGEVKEDLVIVVGTEDKVGSATETKGTLKIGNSLAKETDKYQLTGKAVINEGSELITKGETTITQGVELKDGGKVHVEKGHHLNADIKAEGENNVIKGKVTGDLEAKNEQTKIHLGDKHHAGRMHAKKSKLNGGILFLDPAYAKGIDEGSAFALEDATTLDGAYIAGQNSTISFGVGSTDIAEEVFAKTGLTFGSGTDASGDIVQADVNAVIYMAGTTDVSNGSITANGALTDASNVDKGKVVFADNSLLMVEAEDVKEGAVITGVTSATIDGNAKLYIDDAVKGENYTILEGATGTTINENWTAENISTNNQLIKFTDANVDGKIELKAETKTVNEVYGDDVVVDKVVDEAVSSEENKGASDFFNDAVNTKVNATKDAQVSAMNSVGSINELAGVSHTTYAVSNILTDAVADHMSLENAKEHNKDIWAHYVHTKENVDGLQRAGTYDAQYNGIVVGADLYKEGKATVGTALTYVDGNINGSTLAARTENDAKYYGASIYGSIENKDAAVIADVSYLHGEHDITQRNSGATITGKPESDAFSVGVRVEKSVKSGIGKLVPYAGARYMHLGTGNYANSIGLTYDTEDAELFLLPVGLKYSSEVNNTNGWTVRPVVELGYVWAFGDTDANQTVSLNGASNGFGYDVTDSGSYVGRFMIEAERKDISYALGYEYQEGDNVKADKWMFNVNWKF